jgi:hypothetical protein
MFTVDPNYKIQQYLSQFFAAQLINLEWVKPGSGRHLLFPAKGDLDDGAGHSLVTAYAVERPDGEWSVMAVNRDQHNPHKVRIEFQDDTQHTSTAFGDLVSMSTFGAKQYQWHPGNTFFMAHAERAADSPVVANTKGYADPDGPIAHAIQKATAETLYDLPAASIVVVRGKLVR